MATITEAIASVRRHIDAVDDTERWTDTEIKASLAYGLQKCLEDYVAAGGRRLEEIISVNTNSAGLYAFPSVNPLSIKGISIVQNGRRFPLEGLAYEDQRAPVDQTFNLEIRYTPNLVLSATNSNPLVSDGATAKNTWQSLEEWIIVNAAIYASVIDDEIRQSLMGLEASLRQSVLAHTSIPSALPFPPRKAYLSTFYSYVWIPATKSIQVCRRWA
jgi:hypothetical protein